MDHFTQSGTQNDTFVSFIRVFKTRTPKILEQLPLGYNPEVSYQPRSYQPELMINNHQSHL